MRYGQNHGRWSHDDWAPAARVHDGWHPLLKHVGGVLFDIFGLIKVGGDVADPDIYRVSELRDLPALTQTVTYLSGGTPVTNTFTGALLYDVIADAGWVVTDPAARNDVLSHFVVATGSDGYRAVYSLGEIDPRFGGERIMVAYDDVGDQLGWCGSDGQTRMVVPGDSAGGRYVSDLVSIKVGDGPAFVAGAGGVSTQLTLHGAIAQDSVLRETDLSAMDSQSLTVTYTSAGTPVTNTYTGVLLWDLIQDAGVLTDAAVKNDILGFYVVATGSDGYRAAFSIGEIDPRFGGEQIMVAYDDALGQLDDDGTAGFARMVVPGDTAGGRYVSNLVSLEVVDIDLGPSGDVVWG